MKKISHFLAVIILTGFSSFLSAQTYCTVSGSTATPGYLKTVSFNSINRTSAFDGYINTGMGTTIVQTLSYNLNVTRYDASTYNLFTAAWIDWNDDGDFVDAGENVMTSVGATNAGDLLRTVAVTVPAGAAIGTTKMRVVCKYNATLTGPCDVYATYIDWEDYDITVVSSAAMTYTSSTTTQASTASVTQGSTGNAILGIQVVTAGGTSPLSATSFTFNTTGSTAPLTDISQARLYYTSTSSTFSLATQLGIVTFDPNGSFTIATSQVLEPGTNYFWLTYNIKTTATANNLVDAQCTSINVGGARTPTVTAPAGTRQIIAPAAGAYCAATATATTDFYISNVTFNSINNTTGATGTSMYNDYTGQSTTVYYGESYELIVDHNKVANGGTQSTWAYAWIDWNDDGDFADAGEQVLSNGYSANSATTAYRSSVDITVPNNVTLGATRMRVICKGNTTAASSCGAQGVAGEIEDYTIIIAELPKAIYVSSTVTQRTDTVVAGTYRQHIIGIQVEMDGVVNPFNATQFVCNTAGTTNVANIANARLYSTGTDANFATTAQFGTTIAAPSGVMTFNGTNGLVAGTNYFWLAYDITVTTPTGNCVDATCTSITMNNGTASTVVPSPSAPAGCRPTKAANNMAYFSSTTTQNTSRVAKGEVNQHIIGVEIVTTGALNPLSVTSFTFNTTGTTVVGDIQNAKLWYSQDINLYAGAVQVGGTIAAPSGTFTITPAQVLLSGTNYFWLSYDIKSTAACDPNKVDAQCTSITVGGVARTPTVTNPFGSRIINCGIPYYSKGSLNPNLLSSWSATRDGSGASPGSFAAGSEFYVQYGHTMTSTAALTLPVLYVENGGTMISALGCLITLTDLRINTGGTFIQRAKATSGAYVTNFYMENGSYWIHDNNGYLPSGGRFFEPRSNQWFLQWGGGTFPSGTSWGNVLLNGTTTGNFGMQNCLNTIQGDFEWRRIGSNNYLLDGTSETINVGGDLIFSGGWWKGVLGNGGVVLTLNVTGNFLMTSGIFEDYEGGNSSSLTNLTIGGNVTVSGGTWQYNDSPGGLTSINLSGGVASVTWSQTGGTVSLPNTNIKAGKTVTLTGSKMGDVGASRTVTVESTAALYTATYPVSGTGNFAIQANAKLGMGHSSGYTGNITASGTKTNDAGADFIYYLANTQNSGTFTTTAGAGTTVDPYRLRSLTIDKTSASSVTLQQPLRVTGTAVSFTAPSGSAAAYNLSLINGLLTTTTANVIQVDALATANQGSATSYVNGPIVKKGTDAFIFPTGKSPYWARIQMTAPTAATDFSAEYFATPYSNVTTMAVQAANLQLTHVSAVEHWMFDRLNGTTGNTSLRLYWENSGRSYIYKCDSLAIARWNGSAWENTGPAYSGPACSYGATGNVGFSSTVTNFSPFTFSSLGTVLLNPLPVELLNFDAKYNTNGSVDVTWETASETNNDFFSVERSTDGVEFSSIGTVNSKAPSGNSTGRLNYYLNDRDVQNGIYYYRLKQTDFDNNYKYSSIATVTIGDDISVFNIKPNPTANTTEIVYSCLTSETAILKVYDYSGREVLSKTVYCEKGTNSSLIDLNEQAEGIYSVTLTTNSKVYTSKLVKIK
ncbi:MAG: hypothetical protein K0S44_169 [Bacteroidetes bacterium]|jgi:hypothetical protein|nr:hypothetical protein [Bacteroidota bacterium]